MNKIRSSTADMPREIEELQARLREAEQTIEAIRTGEVDGLVVSGADGDFIFTLNGAQEPYRLIIEQMNDGAVTISREGTLLYANSSIARLVKKSAAALVGHPFLDLVVPEDRDAASELIRSSWTNCGAGNIRFSAGDGTVVPMRLSLGPVSFDPDTVLYIVATDLTTVEENLELRRLKTNLQEAVSSLEMRTAEVEAVNKELESFSYSVSHDLRAPLRHVDGFVQMLGRREAGRLDGTSARYLDVISQAVGKMGRLIDELLAFSRTGRDEIRAVRVDLNALVKEARRELMPAIGGRSIKWVVGTLPAVEGDPTMLGLVVTNLLSNAVKYTGPRKTGRIEIGAVEESDGKATICVRDNGVGFDMEYAEKLFGVFQRLHRDDEFEGIGIGLATVKQIVNRHGGNVWGEGEVDKGAAFYLTL